MRIEEDFLGKVEIEDNALYGIHSLRARNNFPDHTAFHPEWYQAMAYVKMACYQTYEKFRSAVHMKYPEKINDLQFIDKNIIEAMESAAAKMTTGEAFDSFIVPAVSGGAGTSINLNVNEIIANLSLIKLGEKPGKYSQVDPIEHANIYQSTNDVVPTALKVAIMKLLDKLEEVINELRASIEEKETKHRNDLRIAYTQMQEAVPSSFGMLLSSYNDALSRDWWRVSKCYERIKVVNLGGSAVGTGITVPRYFIMEVVNTLSRLTGTPVTRSENMSDATSNLDSFVEVHAIMKAHAVNLEKMVNDLRLMASDLHGAGILSIPQKQTGSSIMPGKVNPVIPEFVISAAHKIYSNDQLITNLSAQGCLDLNAYLPVIGHALLESLKLLIAANQTIRDNLIKELKIQTKVSETRLYNSPTIVTALVPLIGYNKSAELGKFMKEKSMNVIDANKELAIIDEQKLIEILKPENLLKTGFTLKDLD
jgi:aspartate ammonia-lyase